MNKFSKAVMITSIFAVSTLLQAEAAVGSNPVNTSAIPAAVNPTDQIPANLNEVKSIENNINLPSASSYEKNPAGVSPSPTNPQTNLNPSTNAHNNVYTKPANLSSQGRLNSSYNEDKLTPISLSDDEITQKIRSTIRNEKNLSDDAKNITVSTSKGNVTLKGYVASEDEKNKIATLSRKVAGVKSISNNINISSYR